MNRVTTWWAIAGLVAALSGCGTNNITDTSPVTATPTPTATATVTITQTATATIVERTATATATITSTPTATVTATAQPAMLLFNRDPSDGRNPFPSDRLRDATGHVQVPVSYLQPDLPDTAQFQAARDYVTRLADQLTTLSGFSTFSPLRLRFDRPVAVDAGEHPRGLLLLTYDDLTAAPVVIRAALYDPETTVEVQPAAPLKPKTTYALVVTTALTDSAGNHVRPSPDFADLLAGSGLSPELAAWRARLLPVIDYVEASYGIGADSLVLVDLFTTTSTTDDLVTIQQRLVRRELIPGAPVFENSPIQGLDTGIFPEGTLQFESLVRGATNVSAVAIGSFDSYDFRMRPMGAFDPALVSGPTVPPVNHLDFYVTIPKAPAPPGGYPIAIFGHGLGGSGRDVVAVPGAVGDAPIMGVAISALQHGTRGDPARFFVLSNITSTREFFRQTIADFMQLARMVRNAHDAGIAPFDMVDTDRVMYFGVSLGGIMGTVFMAVEPDVRVGMLSVPGGGLANILDSHDIGNLLEPLIAVQLGVPRDSPFFPRFLHRFQQLSQWVLDPADPINYAPYMIAEGAQLPGVPPKRILVHEGIIDNTVPNRTTDDLALAMRLPDLNLTRGCMNPDGCSGIWRFVMTDYGQGELSGHGVSFIVPAAQQQVGEFLNGFGTHVTDATP